jgi:L-fuconate dehydratase
VTERIVELEVRDVRFPTSRMLDGSDAMNPMPDYSAAYVVLRTSAGDEGHSLVFTIGRGTDVQVMAVRAFAPLVAGVAVEAALGDLGAFSRRLGDDC